ncbi:formate acetyltransferase, partial [Escherichia coli]|nr:formate acetyltransferase [Escherichia coli]
LTAEMRAARKSGVITGLPDAYGRGRIIGDYRRVALYGVDFLIKQKKQDLNNTGLRTMSDDVIRQREELNEQMRALGELKVLGENHGFDLGRPAKCGEEA